MTTIDRVPCAECGARVPRESLVDVLCGACAREGAWDGLEEVGRIRDVSIGYRRCVRRTMRPRGWASDTLATYIATQEGMRLARSLPRDVRRILARTAAGRRQLAARWEVREALHCWRHGRPASTCYWCLTQPALGVYGRKREGER